MRREAQFPELLAFLAIQSSVLGRMLQAPIGFVTYRDSVIWPYTGYTYHIISLHIMKIAVLANRDLAACTALNRLWPTLCATHEVQLILSSRVGKRASEKPAQLRDLMVAEQSYFNEFIFPLAHLLPAEQKGPWLCFEDLAEQCRRPLWVLNQINNAEEYEQLAAFGPDLIISIRYGVILKEAVLAIPRTGVLNLHSGLLPDYRGVMASFWAMLNGAESLGTTLHFIDDSTIDTGRVLATTSLPVDTDRSYLWHVLELYEEGCSRILQVVSEISSGKVPDCHAQSGAGNYYSFPAEQQLAEFTQAGFRLFDAIDLLRMSKRFLAIGDATN